MYEAKCADVVDLQRQLHDALECQRNAAQALGSATALMGPDILQRPQDTQSDERGFWHWRKNSSQK
jgi:hypothetical protein